MPQPKYQSWRCSAYRRAMASGAASTRSDSQPASGVSWELVRVQGGHAGQAGSSRVQDTRQIVKARSATPSLSPLASFQSRRFSTCCRCLASGPASSRGASQPATDTSTTSREIAERNQLGAPSIKDSITITKTRGLLGTIATASNSAEPSSTTGLATTRAYFGKP